jgi:dihydroxy-acid dehydratase
MNKPITGVTRRKLRSREWFNNPHNPGMTALYLERYLNYGLAGIAVGHADHRHRPNR